MTNTRITDAEVFERRYPVLLKEFSLRAGSGGAGEHRGGDGVIRDIEFRIPVQVSILSERRVYHPYGLEGGEDAQCGLNIWVRKVETSNPEKSDRLLNGSSESEDVVYEERRINMGGKNTAAMQAGERIIICTPGGGGWGKVGDKKESKGKVQDPKYAWKGGSHRSREETALQA
jgi:5-oxoprolinase (ATP-hydrolysing)